MNNRIYERFLAVVNLAQNPGTEGEGEAAWEMATKMAAKYGFKLPEREVPKQNEEATDWAKKEIWRSFTAKNGSYLLRLVLQLSASVSSEFLQRKRMTAIRRSFVYRRLKQKTVRLMRNIRDLKKKKTEIKNWKH